MDNALKLTPTLTWISENNEYHEKKSHGEPKSGRAWGRLIEVFLTESLPDFFTKPILKTFNNKIRPCFSNLHSRIIKIVENIKSKVNDFSSDVCNFFSGKKQNHTLQTLKMDDVLQTQKEGIDIVEWTTTSY